MCASAIALRPQLVKRARELCGPRADRDAEDLVGIALLVMVARPPVAADVTKLHHWLRRVMWTQNARGFREFRGAVVLSYEGLEEARARRVEE
jgi:DNA-directed RNA polymerase specialized sigma24 family protein